MDDGHDLERSADANSVTWRRRNWRPHISPNVLSFNTGVSYDRSVSANTPCLLVHTLFILGTDPSVSLRRA